MKLSPLPPHEVNRLEALDSYKVFDTDVEQAFDDLTALAAYICGTPIALVNLVNAHQQSLKSKVGLKATEIAGELTFCTHVPGWLLPSPSAFATVGYRVRFDDYDSSAAIAFGVQ